MPIKRVPGRSETNLQGPKPRQCVPAFAEPGGDRAFGQKINFQRANHFWNIVRMYVPARLSIEAAQQLMQRSRPCLLPYRQSLPDRFVARGSRKQPVEERPQVESGSANHHRQRRPGDTGEKRPRAARELTRREHLVRIEHIQHMMRDASPLPGWKFGCPDIEVTINLQRIAVYYFT